MALRVHASPRRRPARLLALWLPALCLFRGVSMTVRGWTQPDAARRRLNCRHGIVVRVQPDCHRYAQTDRGVLYSSSIQKLRVRGTGIPGVQRCAKSGEARSSGGGAHRAPPPLGLLSAMPPKKPVAVKKEPGAADETTQPAPSGPAAPARAPARGWPQVFVRAGPTACGAVGLACV